MKSEFIVEFESGMGAFFAIVVARSSEEVAAAYPMFVVQPLEASALGDTTIEHLRMYPGRNSPPESAVLGLSESDRQAFLARRASLMEKVERLRALAGTAGTSMYLQTWVDIDDDAEFRTQMHEIWKHDERYLALPPQRRLF